MSYCYALTDGELFHGEQASRAEAIEEAMDSVDEVGEIRYTGVCGALISEEERWDEGVEYDVEDVQEHVVTRIENDEKGTRVFYETGGVEGVVTWTTKASDVRSDVAPEEDDRG